VPSRDKDAKKRAWLGEAAMLARIERHPWNWDRTIEAVKVIGVLIAAFWALVQYGNQIEQDRTDAILRAVQVVHDSRAADFRKDLEHLLDVFYVSNAQEFWAWRSGGGDKPSANYHLYKNLNVAPYNREFDHVIMFFDQMYDFSAANACAWKVVQDSFGLDASHFRDYFEPVFDDYANRVHIAPERLWTPLYAMLWDASPAGNSVSCHKSFLEDLSLWTHWGSAANAAQ
jgi:hypothetical protein